MWTIWREEFYKIASRKIIWLGIFLLLSFVTFRLAAERDTYTITRDGERFWGKEAVKKDRELTAALAGRLTEEKIRQIYDQYGFSIMILKGTVWEIFVIGLLRKNLLILCRQMEINQRRSNFIRERNGNKM